MARTWQEIAARAAALALLVAGASAARAAPAEPPRAAQPSLTLSGEALRDRDRGGGATSRQAAVSLRGAVPVVERARLDADGFTAWAIVAQADARAAWIDLPEVEGAPRFLRAGAALAASWVPSPRDSFWLQAGAFVAEQESLLRSPQVHPRAVAVGTHRASDTLRLLYGFGYTYELGRGLPIPLLGAVWRPAPAWRVDVLLPVVARAHRRITEALSLDFGTAVAGEQFRYRAVSTPGDATPGPLEVLHLVRLRLGAGCTVAVARSVRVIAGAGVEGSRVDTGLTTRTALGAYVTAALHLGAPGGLGFVER